MQKHIRTTWWDSDVAQLSKPIASITYKVCLDLHLDLHCCPNSSHTRGRIAVGNY